MKSLYNKIVALIRSFFNASPLGAFRIFAAVFALDFISFLFLGAINPLHLVNPLAFLSPIAKDNRVALSLVYPRSIISESAVTSSDTPVEELVIAVDQKVAPSTDDVIEKSSHILQALIAGPDSHLARPFVEDKALVRDIWYNEGTLSVRLNSESWEKTNARTKEIILHCFRESLKQNTPAKNILFTDI